MKIWLIAVMVVLALIAVNITVRIGWGRFISGIGSLVDGQRHAERLTKQSADIKDTSTDRGQTPKQPRQSLPGAVPGPGDTASRKGNQEVVVTQFIQPLRDIPAPWKGICFVASHAVSMELATVGLHPRYHHECSLAHQKLIITLTRAADNPVAMLTLSILYSGASDNAKVWFAFPGVRAMMTAHTRPLGGGSPGWVGPDAEQILSILLRSRTVTILYQFSALDWVARRDPTVVHEVILDLTGLPQAWYRLGKALAALPWL